MKKVAASFMCLILLTTLLACSNIFNFWQKIEVEIEFSTLSIKSITNDLNAKLSLDPDYISLEIDLELSTKNHDLKVNGVKIESDEYTITDNKITFNFKADKFLDPSDTMPMLLKLNANGGIWRKEDIENQNPDFDFLINSINDEQSTEMTIFTNKKTGLRWHYKLFVKYDEIINGYKVIYADPRNASIENLKVGDFDFIIGLHHHNEDITSNESLLDLFSSNSIDRLIILDSTLNNLSNPVNVKIFSGKPDETSYEILITEETILPEPIKDTFNFLGWSDGVSIKNTYKPLKVKDNQYVKVLTAQYNGLSLQDLDKYLKSLFPNLVDNDLTLPLNYSDYSIEWTSSNEEIISKGGKFNNSFNDEKVTLTANIIRSDNTQYKLIYELPVRMMKSLDNGIASGYVYRGYNSLPDLLFETLDVINTAFIDLDTNGNLNGLALLDNVNKYVMPRARISGSYVVLVIGPASDRTVWSKVAQDTNKINIMANQIVEIINTHGFHGVDIDWEWPYESEKTNFTRLMKVIYEKVKQNNPNHIVTAAIAGGQWQMPNYDLNNAGKYLDYVNMMTYGLTSNGGRYQNPLRRSTSWHNTQLNLGASLNTTSIEESIALFNSRGIPNNKIIVGLAFYGIKQVKSSGDFINGGSMHYNEVLALETNSDYITAYDENAGVPYIYKKDGSVFVSYDNPRSITEKAKYTFENDLAGMMFWEYGTDTTNILLQALKDSMHK